MLVDIFGTNRDPVCEVGTLVRGDSGLEVGNGITASGSSEGECDTGVSAKEMGEEDVVSVRGVLGSVDTGTSIINGSEGTRAFLKASRAAAS